MAGLGDTQSEHKKKFYVTARGIEQALNSSGVSFCTGCGFFHGKRTDVEREIEILMDVLFLHGVALCNAYSAGMPEAEQVRASVPVLKKSIMSAVAYLESLADPPLTRPHDPTLNGLSGCSWSRLRRRR